MLDIIDKNNEIFSLRLFREHCVKIDIDGITNYIKDLSIFHKVDLSDILIVDNSIISFVFHLNNGIAILPFYENKHDRELVYLAKYLNSIVDSIDLREPNRKNIKYVVDETINQITYKMIKSMPNFQSNIEFYDTLGVNNDIESEYKGKTVENLKNYFNKICMKVISYNNK